MVATGNVVTYPLTQKAVIPLYLCEVGYSAYIHLCVLFSILDKELTSLEINMKTN